MQKRKGFTLVELVIVIAVIAILAGVLIGTFASVINRANESADIQKIKSEEIAQKADDIIKKIEESDWFGWEDFESEIVAELTKVYKANNTSTTGLTQNDVTTAVTSAMTTYFANNKVEVSNTMLTAEQVKAIVENALGTLKYEGVTEAQVKAALKEALAPELYSTLKAEQVKGIVETANANNLTAAQLASAVASLATSTSIDQLYTDLTAKLSGAVTEIKDYAAAFATKDDVKQAVDSAIAQAMEIHQDSDPVILAKAFNIRILKAKANNLNTIYDILVAIGATNDVDSLTIPGLFFDLDRKEFFVSATEKEYNVPSTDTYKWWTFVENGTVDSYSTYLLGNASYDTIDLNGVGLDVGQTTVTTINYSWNTEPGHTVDIRTNGGTLVITAQYDTVHHYGEGVVLNIAKINGSSYHEHGFFPKATIKEGHLEIEHGGNIPQVFVAEATGDVKVTANESTVIAVDTASASQTSVVANSTDVYVSGLPTESVSGTQASNVELPTVVTTEAELSAAITDEKAYIQLGASFNTTGGYVIGQKTVFDFAGYTISSSLLNAAFLTNTSTLTFVDTASNGGVSSDNNNVVINHGVMTINGGSFYGNRALTKSEEQSVERGVVYNANDGTLTINDIDLYVKADYGVLNYGSITINGGTYTSDAEAGAFTDARFGYCISSNGGNMVINNATVNGVHGGIGYCGGKGILNNATVIIDKSKNSFYALYIAGEYDVVEATINGGTFNPGKGGKSLYVGNQNDGGLGRTAMTTVNGGLFNGNIYAAFNNASNYGLGILKINGGTFGFNPSTYLDESHTASQDGNVWIVQ